MPFYGIKQIDSSNKFHIYIEVQTLVTHSAVPCEYFVLFLPHFNIICGLLDQCQYLKNCTPTPPLIQPQSTDTVISGRLPTRPITRTGRLLHTAKKNSQQITRTGG